MATKYTNADGLTIRMGGVSPVTYNVGEPSNDDDVINTMFVNFSYTGYPTFDKDANNDGTNDAFSGHTPAIPAGAVITRCFLMIKDAVTGGTATGIDIGLYKADGTAIDADGLFTAAGKGVLSGLTAGAVKAGDGAYLPFRVVDTSDTGAAADPLLPVPVSVGSDAAYIKFTPNGTLATGSGRFVLEYIAPKA